VKTRPRCGYGTGSATTNTTITLPMHVGNLSSCASIVG
jgi:hypothetical protein